LHDAVGSRHHGEPRWGRSGSSRALKRLALRVGAKTATVAALVGVLPACASAEAPELYVSPSGSDSNSCSRSAPCRSLNRANALARPGTTVYVAPGSYDGHTRLTTSGTASDRISYVSTTKWGAQLANDAGFVLDVTGSYLDVTGFDVTGGAELWEAIHLEGSYSRAIGNRVHDIPRGCEPNGAIVTVGGHGQEVVGNLVANIGRGPRNGTCRLLHGVYVASVDARIVSNVIADALGDGITSWHGADRMTVVNNTIVGNGGNGILVGSGDSGARGHTGSYIANNIVAGNAAAAINESSDGRHRVGANTYVANLFHRNGSDAVGQRDGLVSGSMVADPRFVDAASHDYGVLAGSPAIDSGTRTNAPATDFLGQAWGGAPDRGAYSY
jgi:hypothetical protein